MLANLQQFQQNNSSAKKLDHYDLVFFDQKDSI